MRKYNYNLMFNAVKNIRNTSEARELAVMLEAEWNPGQAYKFFEERDRKADKIISSDPILTFVPAVKVPNIDKI